MSEDQFTKLFKYMQERFDAVDKRFDMEHAYFESRLDELTNIIDSYASNLDVYAQEMAAMDHKINRLEKYIQVLADKAGVDLDGIKI